MSTLPRRACQLLTMIALAIMFGSLHASGVPSVQEARQPINTDVQYQEHPLLVQPLMAGLKSVHQLEARYLQLELFLPNGLLNLLPPNEGSAGAAFLTGSEAELFPGVHKFNFGFGADKKVSVTIGHALECGLYDCGYRAARRIFQASPELTPEDLLKCVDDGFLATPSVRQDEHAQALHQNGMSQLRLAPLSNGAIAYVLWGFLHMEEFWASRSAERETFIAELLDRGQSSSLIGCAVTRILQPPLKWSEDYPGRGVAMDLDECRGRVGFTASHEDFLQKLVVALEKVRQDPEGRSLLASTTKTGDGAEVANPLGHLLTWSSEILLWVRRELYPESLSPNLRTSEALAVRLQYWSTLSRSVPFGQFRHEVLAELEAMVQGMDELPGAARMAQLKEANRLGTITEEERAELKRLESSVWGFHSALIPHMAGLIVDSGATWHYVEMASTLARDFKSALSQSPYTGATLDGMLAGTWLRMADVKHPESLYVLHQHLFDPEARLSQDAVRHMLAMAPEHKVQGFEVVLEAALQQGSLYERGSALSRSDWLPAERYTAEVGKMLGECADSTLPSQQRSSGRDLLLNSLRFRSDDAANQMLNQSIESGLWVQNGSSSWSKAHETYIQWAKSRLTAEDRAAFVERKLLPATML